MGTRKSFPHTSNCNAEFVVPSLNRFEDRGGPKIPNVGHVDVNLHFSLVLTAIHICAKFEVSSFYRSGDIRGVPKFQKWVT